MKRILSIIGSVSFLVLGSFIFFMIFSEFYRHLLNPNFMPLAGICGLLLILMGSITLFLGFEVKPSAAIAMIVFILFCLLTPSVKLHAKALKPVRENLNGVQYIPINLGELFMIMYNTPPKKIDSVIKNNNYVFRGMIYRDDKLDQVSNIVAMRIAMVCCFYDSCAYGLRIKLDHFDQYKKNQWVKVYGHLIKFKPDHLADSIQVSDTPNAEVKNDFMFAADKIEPDQEPRIPFMTSFREKEPFDY